MTIINFKVDEKKKLDIEKIVQMKGYKSISEFIREAIDEKMNLQKIIDDFLETNPPLDEEKIEIPDYIPDGKFLGIARNEIVVVGDSLGEVMEKLYRKFPKAASGVLRKGKPLPDFETIFSLFNLENTECYHQVNYKGHFYPILEFAYEYNGEKENILGLVDTGATLMVLDKELFKEKKLNPIRTSEILTANGIIELPLYKGNFYYQGKAHEMEFTISDISNQLKIKALIGKSFIDKFNLMFLGKSKVFCLQSLE